MADSWFALACLLSCLFVLVRWLWFDSKGRVGRVRWPVRVTIRLQLPAKPQEYFLVPPPPIEASPARYVPVAKSNLRLEAPAEAGALTLRHAVWCYRAPSHHPNGGNPRQMRGAFPSKTALLRESRGVQKPSICFDTTAELK